MPKSSSLQLARTVYYTLAHRLYPTPILQALVVAQVQVVEQVVVQVVEQEQVVMEVRMQVVVVLNTAR